MSPRPSLLDLKKSPARGQRRSLRRAAGCGWRHRMLIAPAAKPSERRLNSRRGQKERRFRLARTPARPGCHPRTSVLLERRAAR
jgi:hypothetical protein